MIYWSSFFITSKQINIFETVQLVKHTGATNLDKTIFFKYSMGEGEGGGGGIFEWNFLPFQKAEWSINVLVHIDILHLSPESCRLSRYLLEHCHLIILE